MPADVNLYRNSWTNHETWAQKKLFFIYARIMIFPLDRPQRMIPRCWSIARSTFLQATPTRDCIKVGSSKQCKDQDRIYMTTGKGKRGFWIRWFSRRTLKSVCCHDSFSRFRWKRKPPVPLGHEYHVQLLVAWNGISVLCVPVCVPCCTWSKVLPSMWSRRILIEIAYQGRQEVKGDTAQTQRVKLISSLLEFAQHSSN